jgi:hypothetical protein
MMISIKLVFSYLMSLCYSDVNVILCTGVNITGTTNPSSV